MIICPRCNVMTKESEYEGQSVACCDTCWGYWMTRGALENILKSKNYNFGATEIKAVTNTFIMEGDKDRTGREREEIACPVCAKALRRNKFHPRCAVLIDECPEHGIWLDTGEIKDLQVFIEKFFS